MPRFPGYDEELHQAVSATFLGPRAENFQFLQQVLNTVMDHQFKARLAYYPDDPDFITKSLQETAPFIARIAKMNAAIDKFSEKMAVCHAPFWNPRYNGHMTGDTTLPGIAGYLAGMLFNPNNVAAEASPLTTRMEREVGEELCRMIGYKTDAESDPKAWGHITCDGSIANLESMWAARNLKFYPLSLILAIENPDGHLGFIADSFKVPTCTGTEELLVKMETWDLLNLTPEAVLNIPTRLYAEYSLSPDFLQNELNPFLIQSIGKDSRKIQERFQYDQFDRMAYITSATRHYSWPKGAAISGVGSLNQIPIPVDDEARVDIKKLREALDLCLKEKRAIYAVVAIIGSTEHGACDPLKQIVDLRDEYRKQGLSFVLHADGAWGTYFASMLSDEFRGGPDEDEIPFVPAIALKRETEENLHCLRYCDTVTVDPHKSGYIQYPAGGLLYRDGRMRYLVTWTSLYINRAGEENIGVYGVEGSKPGASAVAVWISHHVIGLDQRGYGALLGQAVFGCAMMYAYFVTMSTNETDYIVVPLNLLPSQETGGDVEKQKQFIRDRILDRKNEDLVADPEAMQLIKDMGSDLSINAFGINFKINGVPNEDPTRAADLGRRVFERLSIVSPDQTIENIPIIFTSTVFSQKEYGECLQNFKARLGLRKGLDDLYTLCNVVMSPFPTQFMFTRTLIDAFTKVLKEETETSITWNTIWPDTHTFIMQGTDKVYLVYLPMFNKENHRTQLVITGDLPSAEMTKYVDARKANPKLLFTCATAAPDTLENLLEKKQFNINIDSGPRAKSTRLISNVLLTNVRVILNRSLQSTALDRTYPANDMPFFLYGSGSQFHIDHALLASPNIQLNSDQVKLSTSVELSDSQPFVVARFNRVPELAMQPFSPNADLAVNPNFFFRPNKTFKVTITDDIEGQKVRGEADLTLGNLAFFDNDDINAVPAHKDTPTPGERIPSSYNPVYDPGWDRMLEEISYEIEHAGDSGHYIDMAKASVSAKFSASV